MDRLRAGVAMLAVFCAHPTSGYAKPQWSEISAVEYARLKSTGAADELAQNRARADRWLDAALVRRVHTGDRTLLMGCDLSDPNTAVERARLERLATSESYESFVAGEQRIAALADALPSPLMKQAEISTISVASIADLEARLALAYSADQTARQTYGEPPPPGFEDLAEPALQLRMDAGCRLDLSHTALVQEAIDRFADLAASAQRHVFILAMHADHEPALQAEAAAAFVKLPNGSTAFASLKDRSELNFGRPQIFGRLYGCGGETLHPDGPGVDLMEVDIRRAEIGLPTFQAEATQACAAYRS